MKKLLLGSTALAAAGLMSASALAADPIKVSINGYYQWYFVVGGWDKLNSGADGRTTSIRQEGEIWFNGITKLDNGTNVGFRIELEAYEFGDQVDEHYLFFSGDWGRIEAGATNGPLAKMFYGAPTALPGFAFNSNNNNYSWNAAQSGNTSFSTAMDDDRNSGDVNKIVYYTPRFAGLQIGVTYAPEFQPGLNGNFCGATGGSSTTLTGPCTKDDVGQWENMFQIVANYLATFNSVNVALYGGVMHADPEVKNAAVTVGGLVGPAGDWWHWLLGAQFTFQGFSIGGNIGRDNNGQKGDRDSWFYAAGVTYTTGPWTVGAGWRGFRRDLPGSDAKDLTDNFQLGANYRIGPGIALVGGLLWNALDTKGNGHGPNEGKDSWQAIFGAAITF